MSHPTSLSRSQPFPSTGPVRWVVALGLFVAFALVYSLVTGARVARHHAPLAAATAEIESAASIGHLWFEEGIAGDRHEEIDVAFESIDRAISYARAILEGGETPEGRLVPLRNPELRREIVSVLEKMREFRALAETRWAERESSGIGSALDQRFDALFHDFLGQTDRVKAGLREESSRDLRRFQTIQGLLVAVALALTVLVGVLFRRYEKRQAVSRSLLQTSQENLSVTLDSIGDAVITTDTDGLVTRLNPVAESLTGWTTAEARKQRLENVFRIIDSQTGDPVESPASRVLRGGRIVGLANHTALIARDGTQRQIADSGAPIRDGRGEVTGVVLVFRDVTEDYSRAQALRESEERYRTVAEDSPVLICRFRPGGEITYANQAYCDYFGKSASELLGTSFLWLIPEEDRDNVMENIAALTVEEPSQSHEHPVLAPDGTVHWQRWTNRALFGDEGRAAAYLAIGEDVTERRRAEEALRRSEAKMQSIFRAAPTGIGVVVDRVIQQVNRRLCEMTGYEEPEIVGQSTRMLYPSDEEYEYVGREKYEQIGRFGAGTVETRWRHKDGRVLDVLLSSSPMDPADLSKGVSFTALDITERKHAVEQAMRFSRVLESSLEEIYLIDAESLRFVDANRGGRENLGYSIEELRALTPLDLAPESTPESMREKIAPLRAGETEKVEFASVHHRKDGTQYPVEVRLHWIADHTPLILAVVSDITERVRLEERVRQAQRVESVGRLAGGVSHDLNNLLSPVLGISEMLLEDLGPDDPHRESVEEILRAGRRARDLVRQLLAFSRKQTLVYEPVDLNRVLDESERLLRRTIREDIEIVVRRAPGLPAVMADTGQIGRVILNLAVNAADAMAGGGRLAIETARVELGAEHAAEYEDVAPGEYVMLAVSDTGEGMSAETQRQVFEPFFSTKGEQGTGLGLATVYGIVRQHEGHIWVYSEPGRGTTFKVYLPISEASPAETAPQEHSPAAGRGTETILLVEDSESVRRLARTILERKGYTVLSAAGGPEALDRLASTDAPVRLLLTDVVMPEMNGKELFTRASDVLPGLRVLYMSGYTDDVIAHRGVLEEGLDFLQKPFTNLALAEKVREVLDRDSPPTE